MRISLLAQMYNIIIEFRHIGALQALSEFDVLKLLLDPVLTESFVQDAFRVFCLVLQILANVIVRVVEHDFLVNEIFVVLLAQRVDLEIEVESRHRFGGGLVLGEVQLAHVGMRESLVNCHALGRVECQHAFNHVDGVWVSSLENCGEILSLSSRQALDELLVFRNCDLLD